VIFREMLARFPNGRYADRAAWKVGWWAYKHARFLETARQFETAARTYPRSDYRPAFLYWTARSYGQLGNRAAADAAALATIAAYGSSYYGRLAAKLLGPRAPQPPVELPPAIVAAAAGAKATPTDELIGLLISLELYDQALDELLYAQRTWGSSALVDATLGFVYSRKADYRRGINAMKRAYPAYLAAGGERLPAEVSRVIFPVDHWPLVQQHASAHKLDPYLLAALIAQESSFDPDIRSRANAIGLMQILPSTGRRYARKLGIRRYSTAMLTRPEVNIQIGVTYFSDLVKQFERTEYALCAYNAGENRIEQWIAERPGLALDEFIDDVPFPETQNYLRKVLGTADDYRRLYGPGSPTPAPPSIKTDTSNPPATTPAKRAAPPKTQQP
jgi:soluble lytic murein transglycosylase